MICGGVDLGGTKIEARLFDGPQAETLATHRIPTPQASFEALLDGLIEAIAWLRREAGERPLPIGLSIAGIVEPQTGVSFAANLPATDHAVGVELGKAVGQEIATINDCMAFAFSEAHGGAGADARSVMGLIIGTGVGGGICFDGMLPPRHGGLAVEVGHVGLSAATLARHGLPIVQCGCGQMGCIETYVAGPGITRLAEHLVGKPLSPKALGADPSPEAQNVLDVWADIAADCLYTVQITLDPECIVIGGGVSNLPDCAGRLSRALATRGLSLARRPEIRKARFGDSSGARGAALVAKAHAVARSMEATPC